MIHILEECRLRNQVYQNLFWLNRIIYLREKDDSSQAEADEDEIRQNDSTSQNNEKKPGMGFRNEVKNISNEVSADLEYSKVEKI